MPGPSACWLPPPCEARPRARADGRGTRAWQAATGRVIAELAAELDRVSARRDALAAEIEGAFLPHPQQARFL